MPNDPHQHGFCSQQYEDLWISKVLEDAKMDLELIPAEK